MQEARDENSKTTIIWFSVGALAARQHLDTQDKRMRLDDEIK
jgi:hypothetical protein